MSTTTIEVWQAWIRPIRIGLMIAGVRRDDETDWTPVLDAPSQVREYLDLKRTIGRTLINPEHVPNLTTLRELAGSLVNPYAGGEDGDVLLGFEVDYRLPTAQLDEISIDLKWSLWTTDRSVWDERADDALARMATAYAGTEAPVVVITAPYKEIRYGRVTIRPGTADVDFKAAWDDVRELMDTHGLDPDNDDQREPIMSYFSDGDGFTESGDTIGALQQTTVTAASFEELLARIDDIEAQLLVVEQENGEHFAAFCRALVTDTDPS